MKQFVPIQFIFSAIWIVQNNMNKIVSTFVYTLVHFKILALLYSRVGAGAGAASKFYPGAGAA
jgi:hypothetical protein